METNIFTGFNKLDDAIQGINKANLIVIASRPSMGKTAFALNIATNVAIRQKLSVAIFSLEMSKKHLIKRILCSKNDVDIDKVITETIEDEDFSEKGIYIDDTPAISINKIREECINLKKEKNIKLILIDSLELIRSDNNNNDAVISQPRIKKMYPVGIALATYVICENEDGMYIIDQHAAAERINYEKYFNAMKQKKKDVINLLIPIKVELPSNEFILLRNNINIMLDMGFDIEEFGINTYIVRAHPTWLPDFGVEEAIKKIINIDKKIQRAKRRINEIFYNFIHRNNNGINHYLCTFFRIIFK